MSLLKRHLEQISLSAETIASLPFPPPKIFTNALLHTPDITLLIRDTEPHERALFSVAQPPQPATSLKSEKPSSSRRRTVFNVSHGEVMAPRPSMRAPRQNTAVAAVLGPELNRKVEISDSIVSGDIDVEVLLCGVEKLNTVYSVPGVIDKVQDLRRRYAQISREIPHYEDTVEKQTTELEKMNWENQNNDYINDMDDENEDASIDLEKASKFNKIITDDEIRKEENEIRELENRRRELEKSITRMESDLGGLRR
ncbi:putative dash complex subunit spc34 [Golovinomyces cichoracearum]|uniref:DASH complex subunit SPC34 n=1 Tax=Golovinomyces cichoracearum TaxID=62708 RepID=A0A420HMC1_9PEZI|nr:putative dash complex subunit spc34 [Golovinomyces cichoracearum]